MIKAFGTNIEAAKSHYENHGLSEGRTITFDPAQYLSNYGDLTRAFGTDQNSAVRHFINYGHKEGRTFESSATTSQRNFLVFSASRYQPKQFPCLHRLQLI